MKGLLGLILLGLLGCSRITVPITVYEVGTDNLNWSIDLNSDGTAIFIRNDSLLVVDGKNFLHLTRNGDSVHLNYQPHPTHKGSMLSHYASCIKTNSNYRCKVELVDSSLVKNMYLRVEGINNKLTYPKFYLSLNHNVRQDIVLDFNITHLQIFDIAQLDSKHFAFLYEYTPHEINKTGVRKVGLIDLEKLFSKNGYSPSEYIIELLNK